MNCNHKVVILKAQQKAHELWKKKHFRLLQPKLEAVIQYESCFFSEGILAETNPSEIYPICATYHISYNYEFDDLGDGSGLKADCDICSSTHPPRPLVSGTIFCRHWQIHRFIHWILADPWAMFDSSSDVWSDMFGGHFLENYWRMSPFLKVPGTMVL